MAKLPGELIKAQIAGSYPIVSDSEGLRLSLEFAQLIRSQGLLMLLVHKTTWKTTGLEH